MSSAGPTRFNWIQFLFAPLRFSVMLFGTQGSPVGGQLIVSVSHCF